MLRSKSAPGISIRLSNSVADIYTGSASDVRTGEKPKWRIHNYILLKHQRGLKNPAPSASSEWILMYNVWCQYSETFFSRPCPLFRTRKYRREARKIMSGLFLNQTRLEASPTIKRTDIRYISRPRLNLENVSCCALYSFVAKLIKQIWDVAKQVIFLEFENPKGLSLKSNNDQSESMGVVVPGDGKSGYSI